MSDKYVVLGSGGHAAVVLDILRELGRSVKACTDINPERVGETLLGAKIIHEETMLDRYPPGSVRLINGIGGAKDMEPRKAIFERFRALGYSFGTLVHPAAFVAPDVPLGVGCQILAGAIVITGSEIGDNAIINTKASVDHDCIIGAHTHIAPGATLCGNVSVGPLSLVGTGASVIQGVTIGTKSIIGAGSAVIHNVADKQTVFGVPATPKD